MAGGTNRVEQRSQRVLHLGRSHPGDQRQPTRDARRVEPLAQLQDELDLRRGADLAAERVAHATQELDVRPVELAGALADPQHVRRAVVPAAGERVLAGERLLVAEQQRLVAGVEVDLVEVVGALRVDPAGAHEAQRPVDLRGDQLVALALRAGGDELLVPHVDLAEIGEAALGEGAQQVERRCRLVVGLHEPLGVGGAGGLGGRGVVDDVATEAGDADVADLLERRRAGLGELPGDAPDLHRRHAERVGQDDRHLQDDLELLADVDRGELLEALGAVAGLDEEGVARGDLAERGLQGTCLAGEHQRRVRADLLQSPVERAGIGPLGLLLGEARLPRGWSPRRSH